MKNPHKYLKAAKATIEAAENAIEELKTKIEDSPPDYLTTIAINLWSPYLPFGRKTVLRYPKNSRGESIEAKLHEKELNPDDIFRRYISLMGRNLSPNHLLLEVKNVGRLFIDANQERMSGPTLDGRRSRRISLTLPRQDSDIDSCFRKLVPPDKLDRWIKWLGDPAYESRYENLLREELGECRKEANEKLPQALDAFIGHLKTWIEHKLVPPITRLAEFDERWLSRMQLTAIASKIWGPIWVTRTFSLDKPARNKLELLASCTITGMGSGPAGDPSHPKLDKVQEFSERQFKLVQTLMKEKLRVPFQILNRRDKAGTLAMKDALAEVENGFSGILGGSLIGADHEGEPVSFRGLLTPGLDALPKIAPNQLKIVHEVDYETFRVEDGIKDHWGLWKAYFTSNDLFLSDDGVALHFELVLTDHNTVIPIPRHVVQVRGSFEDFLQNADRPSRGLLQMAFATDKRTASHFRYTTKKKVEQQIQLRHEPFEWGQNKKNAHDWRLIADTLCKLLILIRNQMRDDDSFVKEASTSLSHLTESQIAQLADGIAETSRRELGCLVFIGPVIRNKTDGRHYFYSPVPEEKLEPIEITRLGVSLPIVSEIPHHFSEDFRTRFATLAGLDGETIVSTGIKQETLQGFDVDPPKGGLIGRQFVQLPQGTPALIAPDKPGIFELYDEAWNRTSNDIEPLRLIDKLKALSELNLRSIASKTGNGSLRQSDLLSLGTRHRKAAMTTCALPSVVAITCSASGNIRIWLRGVPVVEFKPDRDFLLPHLPVRTR